MKKLTVLLVLVILVQTAVLSQCLPYGITLTTQEQINSFQTDYPDCTEIGGRVIISGNSITNLDGLSNITGIGEELEITNCGALVNLTGLDSVSSIGGYLYIHNNDTLMSLTGLENVSIIGNRIVIDDNLSLVNLSGLESLTTIHGKLHIANNYSLTSLTGLDNVTTIYGILVLSGNVESLAALGNVSSLGGINFSSNHKLTNLTGLEKVTNLSWFYVKGSTELLNFTGLDNLVYIYSTFEIMYNYALTSLTGLEKVSHINGNIYIEYNDSLKSLVALEGLKSIEGAILINENKALTSLVGLDNINVNTIYDLYLINNDSLSICEVKSVCDFLSSSWGDKVIYGNDSGCDSVVEVEQACETVSVEEQKFSEQLSSYPNPFTTSTTIAYELPRSAAVQISIYNQLGTLVDVIQETQIPGKQQVVWNANGQSSGMYYFTIQIGKETVRGKMVKMGN